MMNEKILKIIGLLCILIVLANMLLFAFRVITPTVFWIVIIFMAIIAFPGMKMLRKTK